MLGCSQSEPTAMPQNQIMYRPPAPLKVERESSASTTIMVGQDRHTDVLRRVVFQAVPSLREGALAVLNPTQLDELDRAFLGRFDLHAFAQDGSSAFVWLASEHVRGADVQLKDGRRMRVGYYPGSPAGLPGWYDQDGLSLASEILGRPVALSRVTSRFGERLHPITGQRKQHRGVDYGAPEGTPVFAVGAGVVTTLAVDASAGNHLKLDHASDFQSWYLHLHHFAAGLAKGSLVKQGEVIGYVGTTGASTGPHLHFELHRNGLALDPQRKLSSPLTALGPLSQPQHRKTLEAFP